MASQINPQSMLGIGITLPVLSILIVCARFYVRITHNQGLRAYDWLILPALLMVIGLGITIIIGVEQHVLGSAAGTGDQEFVSWSIVFVEQLEYAAYLLITLSLGFVKLSLIYFYRRIFCTGYNKAFDIFTKTMAVIVVLWTISLFFTFIFNCGTNVALRWGSFANMLRYCSDTEAEDLYWVASDVILDIILFVIPIPLILQLKLSSGRRLAILFVFALGALAVVTSIIRLVIFALTYAGEQNDFIAGDPLIALSLFFYWSMFECGIAIIVACLPILQVWFRKISIDAVTRNVLGIFSVQSLSRGSHKSDPHRDGVKDVHSSRSNLNDADSVELDEVRQNRVYDEEHQR